MMGNVSNTGKEGKEKVFSLEKVFFHWVSFEFFLFVFSTKNQTKIGRKIIIITLFSFSKQTVECLTAYGPNHPS